MRKTRYLPVMLIVLVAAVIRLWNLDFASLWADELQSIDDSQSLFIAWTKIFHPPMYFSFLYFWRQVFGSSDFAVRALTVLFGCMNTGMVFIVATDVFKDRKYGLVAALFYALLPSTVSLDREARMYAQWTTFYLIGFWGYWGVITGGGDRRRLTAFILGSVFALGTHYYTVIFFAPLFISIAYQAAAKKVLSMRKLFFIAAPIAVLGIATIIIATDKFDLIVLLSKNGMVQKFDMSRPIVAVVGLFHLGEVVDQFPPWLKLPAGLLFSCLVGYGAAYARSTPFHLFLAWALPLAFINLAPVRNHNYRYWHPSFAVGGILLAGALVGLVSQIRKKERGAFTRIVKWPALVFVTGVTALFLYNVPQNLSRIYQEPKESWREAVRLVKDHELPGDLILVNDPFLKRGFNRYYDGRLPVYSLTDLEHEKLNGSKNIVRFWYCYGNGSLAEYRKSVAAFEDTRPLLGQEVFPRFRILLFGETKEEGEFSHSSNETVAPRM